MNELFADCSLTLLRCLSGTCGYPVPAGTKPTTLLDWSMCACIVSVKWSVCIGHDRDVPYNILSAAEAVPLPSQLLPSELLLVPHAVLDTHQLHRRSVRDTFAGYIKCPCNVLIVKHHFNPRICKVKQAVVRGDPPTRLPELTQNLTRSSHGHSTPSLKISRKLVLPFSRNVADKETKKERKKSPENNYQGRGN